jgi:hypothetical protein
MSRRRSRALGGVLVVLGFSAFISARRGAGQEPALSGLTPEPTPASAISFTPPPTPTVTRLSGGRAESGVVGRGGSLADIVKISKDARKDQTPKKSLGTITNESLRKGATPAPTPSKGAAAARSSSASGAPKNAAGGAPTPASPYEAKDDKGRTESDWRGLVSQKTALVATEEARVRDLETKSRQLENDFYAMSDGNRRDAVVKPAWDKARDDLAKARQSLEDARKAVDDLAEEARKSNAPPGWLR